MKTVQKIISLLLTVTLVLGMVPVTAGASETEAALDPGRVTVEGTNSLGTLLSEEIQNQQAASVTANEEYDAGFAVTGLQFSGATATVTYDAAEEATLLVAVYTEDGMTLLNSAYKIVTPDETTATVTLSGEMPQYFMASAYLLNTYDLSPLCQAYDTPVYTQSMQELLDSTVEDYPEDRVLNLNDDNTTNFLVYTEDTVVIEEQAGMNTVISADDETMTYVIGNADAQFTSLQPGDVLAYSYGDDQYVIAKVATIEVEGATVTIYGADVDIDEVFSHMKLEGTGDSGNATIDTSGAGEGLQYIGDSAASPAGLDDDYVEGTVSKQFPFVYAEGLINSKLTVGVDANFAFLKADDMLYTKLAIDLSIAVDAYVEAKVLKNIPLGKWQIPMAYGAMSFVCEPQFKLEVSAKMNFNATVSTKQGFWYETGEGFHPIKTTPSVKTEVSVEGTIFLGVDLNPGVEVVQGYIVDVAASLPIGVDITAKESLADREYLPQEEPEEKHSCEHCLEIKVDFKADFVAGFKLLGYIKKEHHVAGVKVNIGEAYYSIDHEEFDWGKCPYKEFRVTVIVRDSEASPVSGASVETSKDGKVGESGVTNGGGICSIYLDEGTYTIRAASGELQRSITVQVEEPRKVIITLPETPEEETEETPGETTEGIQPSLPEEMLEDLLTRPVGQPGRLSARGTFELNGMQWSVYTYKMEDDTYFGKLVITGSGELNNEVWVSATGNYIKEDGEIGAAYTPSTGSNEIVFGEGITSITGLTFWCDYVTLPSTLRVLGDDAFYNNSRIAEITLPDGLTYLGSCAFMGCTNLKELVIPGSVQKIGDHVLGGSGIERLVIQNGVTELAELVIETCPKLKSVTLPGSLRKMGQNNFISCTSLRQVNFPEGLEVMGPGCFYGSGLREINIPSSLKTIGESAFADCDSLESVVIPSTVTEVGAGAFEGCDNLKSFTVLGGMTEIGESAFYGNQSLEQVVLGEGVTKIGDAAFHSCANLQSVQLPNTLAVIGASAFDRSGLPEITIPGSVQEIGSNAFLYCDNLKKVTVLTGVECIGQEAFQYCSALTDLVLPEGLKKIDSYAFFNCDSLTGVTIPKTVEYIGGQAFGSCENLETITFEGFDLSDGKDYGISLYGNAFRYCAVTRLELPCLEKWQYPFIDCQNLETVVIDGWVYDADAFPDSIHTIYYPYAYSLANYPEEDPDAANYYYTTDRMGGLGLYATWIPYTVDGNGTMIPMEELAYCHATDWGNHPFALSAETNAIATEQAESAQAETEPPVTEIEETLPIETQPEENHSFTSVTLPTPAAANTFRVSAPGTAVRAMSDKEEFSLGQIVAPALDAIYGGDYSSEVTEERTVKIADFSGLVPGEEYLLLALTSLDAADPLSIDSLIHIDQGTAAEDGTLRFEYVERQDFSISYVMVSGPSNKHLKDATIIFPRVYASDGEQVIDPVVIYGGQILTEGTDYALSGKIAFTAAGTYTCYIRGIYNYTGLVECTYTVEDPTATEPPAEDFALESFCIAQDYLLISAGETVPLAFDIQPAELAEDITWTVEESGENVLTVEEGTVTALKAGTAYVVASVSDGEVTLTDRCRIDVAEAIQLDGIQLGTTKLTTELYSTDYAQFDILLKLPQNYAATAASTAEDKPEDLGIAITDAYFADADMAELFDLVTMDDRTVAVVPTEKALTAGKAVQGKYTGAVTVIVQGKEYTSEPLTLTVKKSLPKLKASMDALNKFYSFHSAQIEISGATVTGISCENLPDWLTLKDGILSLTEMVPAKGGSAKLTLQIETEEWAVPVEATLSVKCSYKTPNIKMSTSSVQFSADAANSTGVQLQLLSKEKNKTLEDLGVTGVSAPAGYSVSGFDAKNGTFTLKPESGFQPGKINLEVIFGSTSETMKLPLTVKATAVSLKLSTKSITLNSGTGDSAAVIVTAAPDNYQVTAPKLRLEGSDKSDKLNSGELSLSYDNGKLSISTTDLTPDNTKYTLYISAAGGKEETVKISTTNAEPTLKLKTSGNLDLSFPNQKISLTTTFKNHSGGNLRAIDYTVVNSGDETVNAFSLTKEGSNLYLSLRDTASINVKSTYMLNLTLTLEDGRELPASVKIPVKQTAVNLKLASNKVTLNNTISDKAAITVTCGTKGYEFTKPFWELMDGKGKESAEGKLAVNWVDGKLVIGVNENTEYGTSYKLMVSAAEGAKATALTVTIPAANKSGITGTLKLTGNLDVVRDETSITVTPTFKNCGEADREDTITVLNGNGEDVTNLFTVKEEEGKHILTRAEKAKLDPSQKYTVVLTADFGDGITATATTALKLKMGSAKLTLNTNSTTLFANDRNSRVSISFTSADGTLNKVAKAELDPKLQSQFELFDYGNGQYAIGFKDGVVPAKITSANISLNVWLEGNGSAKSNASLKVKLSIVR